MKIIYRRLTYTAFIVIFLVAAPLIVLYTAGYRYNFAKGRVQKTGILKISSVPKGADIYLNGVKYTLSQTPAKIEKVLPGDYQIKLSKPGYFDWQKKLPVYENYMSLAEKIILWKQSAIETLSASTSAASWLTSPDKNIIAFSDNSGRIGLLNINSGLLGETSGGSVEYIASISPAKQLKLDSFSPTGRYLIAENKADDTANYYLIDTLQKTSAPLKAKNLIAVKWAAGKDLLYALDASGLSSIDLASKSKKGKALALAASDFLVDGNDVYAISGGKITKGTLSSFAGEAVESVACPACGLAEMRGGKLMVADQSAQKLFIINLSGQIQPLAVSAKDWDWLNDNSLIYYNDYEIYIFDTDKDYPELVTRLGTKINSAVWYPKGLHLAFSTDNKLKIIELDNREYRNIQEVAVDAAADYLRFDRAGNNLFFSGTSAGKNSLFKLNLQ